MQNLVALTCHAIGAPSWRVKRARLKLSKSFYLNNISGLMMCRVTWNLFPSKKNC